MMAQSGRLRYKVVKCTSEDPDYPVSDLLLNSPQTRGWQTARFCEFPQEIGLEFDSPVQLRQVQFLSHQTKIATKIELFTALPPDGPAGCDYGTAHFKRLGYLSLDSNERSQYQARELKTVDVDVSALFLRILFHKCHVNRFNIVNQVGIIALNCLGDAKGPSGPMRSASAAGLVVPLPRVAQAPNTIRAISAVHPPAAPPRVVVAAPSEESRFDALVRERVATLTAAKQQAVDREDYDEAKRLKSEITELQQVVPQLRRLEEQKEKAVAEEDFDAAKRLKVDIESLRLMVEDPEAFRAQAAAVAQAAQVATQVAHASLAALPPPSRGTLAAAARPFEPLPRPGTSSSEGCEASARTKPQTSEPQRRATAGAGAAPVAGAGAPPGGGAQRGRGSAGSPQREAAVAPGYADEGEVAGPGRAGGRARPRSTAPEPDLGEEPPQPSAADAFAAAALAADASHPLAGVPAAEDRSPPEPLSDAVHEEVAPLVGLFGEYLVCCLYSKSWSNRDAGLHKLALSLRDGAVPGAATMAPPAEFSGLARGIATVLRRSLADKNVQVFTSAAGVLQAFCDCASSSSGRSPDAKAALEPLLPMLVDRLGDSNARADSTAREAHMHMASVPGLGASFAAQCLMRPPSKKPVPPRVYSSRLQLLGALVAEAGLQPERAGGLALDPVMQLAMAWFSNPHAEVRENVVKLVATCFAHAGLARIDRYLSNLRQAQREVFDAEFQRASTATPPPRYHEPGGCGSVSPNSGSCGGPRGHHMARGMPMGRDTDPFDFAPEVADLHPHAPSAPSGYGCCGGAVDARAGHGSAPGSAAVRSAPASGYGHAGGSGYGGGVPANADNTFGGSGAHSGGCGAHAASEGRGRPVVGEERDHLPARLPGRAPAPPTPPASLAMAANAGAVARVVDDGGAWGAQAADEADYADVGADNFDDEDEEVPEFTCQFCRREDPGFTPEALDVHYWRECPMLTECELCHQVIEICRLHPHLVEECEVEEEAVHKASSFAPDVCPLCRASLGGSEDVHWRRHLLAGGGCPRNPRLSPYRGGAGFARR